VILRSALGLAAAVALGLTIPLGASGHPGHGKGGATDVDPGPDAITKALARADGGDVLHIHRGHYREAITITEPVKLIGPRKGRRPVIDAQCASATTIGVGASGVVLKRLKVVGATAFTEVDFRDVASGRAEDLVLRNTCDAEYGINVVTSAQVSVLDNRATGFTDAGIYVGDITDTAGGTLVVRGNRTSGNNKGIIVELSAGGSIRVEGNDVRDNALPGPFGEPVGIFINQSDGVQLAGNSVLNNGSVGIHLTPDADANVLNGNTVTGNPTDIRNEGSGNCGSGNVASTGDPLPPC
jgi:parallel beta-helix repeat protein